MQHVFLQNIWRNDTHPPLDSQEKMADVGRRKYEKNEGE